MKQASCPLLFFVLSLFLPISVSAQYTVDPNASSDSYSPGFSGRKNMDGGPLSIMTNFILHYEHNELTPADYAKDRQSFVDELNETSRETAANMSFRLAREGERPNLDIYFDMYAASDDTYSTYVTVRGEFGYLRYNVAHKGHPPVDEIFEKLFKYFRYGWGKPLFVRSQVSVETEMYGRDDFFKRGPVKLSFWDHFSDWVLNAMPDVIPALEGSLAKSLCNKHTYSSEVLSKLGSPMLFSMLEFAAISRALLMKQAHGEFGDLIVDKHVNLFYVQAGNRVLEVRMGWYTDAGWRGWILGAKDANDRANLDWDVQGCTVFYPDRLVRRAPKQRIDEETIEASSFSKSPFFTKGPVKIGTDEDFRNWVLKPMTSRVPGYQGGIVVSRLNKPMLNSEILSESDEPKSFTADEFGAIIHDLLLKQPRGEGGLLSNETGLSNIFYVRLVDRVVVVDVSWGWGGQGWLLFAFDMHTMDEQSTSGGWLQGSNVFSRK